MGNAYSKSVFFNNVNKKNCFNKNSFITNVNSKKTSETVQYLMKTNRLFYYGISSIFIFLRLRDCESLFIKTLVSTPLQKNTTPIYDIDNGIIFYKRNCYKRFFLKI